MAHVSRDNPFPGLRPFEFEDRAFFFGRKSHLLELHRKLVTNRFVAVVGASGSGKSSLVKAGLLGLLHDEWERRSGPAWRVLLLRPQGDPIHELARQLAVAKAQAGGDHPDADQQTALELARAESRLQHSSLGLSELLDELVSEKGGRVLLVIDQFEELFRYPYAAAITHGSHAAGLDQRTLFVKHLLEASEAHGRPFHLLITMRSEFLGDCTEFRGLPEVINDSQFLTPRLTRDQRRETIVGPIEMAGGSIAPALVQRLLNDVGNEPDQLPVLQHALMRTWVAAAPGRHLELSHYETAGRMERSISDHANNIYAALEPPLQSLAERVFKSLTDVDREGRETRRPCRFSRLIAETGASTRDVQAVIDPFRAPDCAFIVPTGPTVLTADTVVDISHEALIRKWSNLASSDDRGGWVATEAGDGRTYGRLLHVAEAHSSDPAILLSPAETKERSTWWQRRQPNQHWAERYGGKFQLVEHVMTASRASAEHESRRRTMRRAGLALAAAVGLIVLGYGYAKERTAAIEKDLRVAAEHSREAAENARNDAEVNAAAARRAEKQALEERDKVQAERDRAQETARAARSTLETAPVKDPGWHGLKTESVTSGAVGSAPFGALVTEIEGGSPAAKADIRQRDAIIAINAAPITTAAAFDTEMAKLSAGIDVTLWRVRGNQPVVPIAMRLAARPASQARATLEIELEDMTKAEAEKLGWDGPRGIKVVKLREGGPAASAGIRVEDVILSLDGQEVESVQRFVASIGDKAAGAQVRLRLLRAGRERTLNVTLGLRPAETAQEERLILMLDTGGHMAVIKGLAFTPDGTQLLSAGDDKVIRVWDWQAGKTVRIIRGQVGQGHEGKVFALALSPDGRWLAVGGWAHNECGDRCGEIRLYEFATGRLVALLKGHTNVVSALAFSRDGTRLISGSADSTAILWDVNTRALVHHLRGHTDYIYAIAFTPDGKRAVTGSYDATLRLWSVTDGRAIATMAHQASVRVLAVSQTSGIIAAGDFDGEIRLWDGTSGQLVRTLGKQRGRVGAIAFDQTGKRLITTCGGGLPCSDIPQTVWDVSTGKELAYYRGHRSLVLAAAARPDSRFLAATGDFNGEIHLWDGSTGSRDRVLRGTGVSAWSVGFSADGKQLAWGNTYRYLASNDRAPLEFQIRLPDVSQTLGRPERLARAQSIGTAGFVGAQTRVANHALALRRGLQGDDAILDVMKDGKVVASIERGPAEGYRHLAYTFTPNGESIISGGEGGNLIAYDLAGRKIGQFLGHDSDVWALAASPNGRLVLSAGGDQAIRLWNPTSRELIITLFQDTDGEWVMWTPQGYYTGSPGSDKIVGWQINKGPDQAADYVGADQLRQHLNRPDIVEKSIVSASAEAAVRNSPGTTFRLADLLARPVPRFRVLSPTSNSTLRGGRTPVKIAIEPVLDPIKSIRVQVNGRQVDEITPDIGAGGFKPGELILDVPLSKGRNDVRITLSNDIGDRAETLTLAHEGEGDLDKRGTLYILAIGVDRYPGLGNTCGELGKGSCDLKYSGADARLLADAVERRMGPAHTRVVNRVLVNGSSPGDEPTAINIIDALDLFKQAKETDTVVLFIAGHGSNDGPSYRFLATNAERSGDTYRSPTVVPWQFLQEAVESAKGRRILFIDTAHSGNAYNQRLGNAAYHANIITYTSSRFDQEAMENADLGHGLFTYAVVEGLGGKGNLGVKREISTKELADYVVKRVDQLAKAMKGEQEPQYYKGRDAEDYVLAR